MDPLAKLSENCQYKVEKISVKGHRPESMSPCFHQGVYHAVPQAGFLSRPAGSLQLSGQETPSGGHQGGSSWLSYKLP
jgi:hypothetical protein